LNGQVVSTTSSPSAASAALSSGIKAGELSAVHSSLVVTSSSVSVVTAKKDENNNLGMIVGLAIGLTIVVGNYILI
jgi:hypothetical protein